MIIAKQIPIDRQESPIEIYGGADCYYDDICVLDYGYDDYDYDDSYYSFRIESNEYKKIDEIFNNFCMTYGSEDYEKLFRLLNPIKELPPIEVMETTLDNFICLLPTDDDYVEAVKTMLEHMTENEYKIKDIYGSVQGEHGVVIYPSNRYTDDDIDKLGMEVYNTGTEWKVTSGEDDESEYFYSHGYDDDTNRKEIAEAFGVEPSEVTLEVFTGYAKVANYERR